MLSSALKSPYLLLSYPTLALASHITTILTFTLQHYPPPSASPSHYSAKSALSSTLNNNNNNNTEGQDFALFSPPPKSQYGTGNGRNGQGKEVREMARARTGSIESEKSSVSFRSNGSNGTYSSNYQDQYATGTGTRGTASVTLYPSVKNYSISSTRDGNMWRCVIVCSKTPIVLIYSSQPYDTHHGFTFSQTNLQPKTMPHIHIHSFSFFPLDEQHVMTVAKGQLEDSIPSFQRCAWGAALPTGYVIVKGSISSCLED